MNIFRSLQVELIDGCDGCYGLGWGGAGRIAIRDDFSRLYLLKSGRAEVRLDGRVVELVPGPLYLFPCGHTAWYRCVEPMRLCWVHFRMEHLPGLDVFSRFETTNQAEKIRKSGKEFKLLLQGIEADHPEHFLRAVRALLRLAEPFFPKKWEQLTGSLPAAERLRPSLDYIRAHLVQPEIGLKQMAKSVHLHPTYFSNLFKEVMGVTPMQFLTDLRLRQARTLLLTTELNVGEISVRCGYTDPFYFSRVFKKNTGMNPRQFRGTSGIFAK